jgi:trk system potassium uptake protein TrkA
MKEGRPMARKSYAIVGTGQFGNYLARTLAEHGQDVLVLDDERARLQPVEDVVSRVVLGNIADEAVLQEVGIRNFDVVVVASTHQIEKSLMAVTLCKELGCPFVIAKAASALHAKMLQRLGVDRVIQPDLDMARRLGRSLLSRSLLDFIAVTEEFSIIELPVSRGLVGKTLAELKLRERFSINVALIQSHSGRISVPEAHFQLRDDDVLIVLGRDSDLQNFEEILGREDAR